MCFRRSKKSGICDYCKDIEPVGTTKWISVKDRLPEIDQVVLVFKPDDEEPKEEYYICKFHGGINNYWYIEDNLVFLMGDDITHWMPLPESPNDRNTDSSK